MDTVSLADNHILADKHPALQQQQWTLALTKDTTAFIHPHKIYCHRWTEMQVTTTTDKTIFPHPWGMFIFSVCPHLLHSDKNREEPNSVNTPNF